MHIHIMVMGPLQVNCYICWTDQKDALVIDPAAEGERILSFLEKNKLKLLYIINTHGHGDHIGANKLLKEKTGASIYIHHNDADMLLDAQLNLSAFFGTSLTGPAADILLSDGDTIHLGSETFTVITTPGHTLGSICLFSGNILFSGDTLFHDSIGRTDFDNSSETAMAESLARLKKLDAEYIVYPGHGPSTTLKYEFAHNPFLV